MHVCRVGQHSVLTDTMVVDVLPGLLILYLPSLLSSDRCCCGIGFRSRTSGVLSVLQMLRRGAWLDAMPTVSNCVLGDSDVVSSLRYLLGMCSATMQDKPVFCECGKPFSPGQALRCRVN